MSMTSRSIIAGKITFYNYAHLTKKAKASKDTTGPSKKELKNDSIE